MSRNEPDIRESAVASKPAAKLELNVVQVCLNCSARMAENHCKLVCRQCGYFLSCSDFY